MGFEYTISEMLINYSAHDLSSGKRKFRLRIKRELSITNRIFYPILANTFFLFVVGEGAGAEGWYSNNNNNKTFFVLSKYFSNIYFTTLCHCIYTQLMAHCSFQEVKPDVYCNNEAPNLIFSFFFCRHYHQWISNIYSCISNKAYTNYLTDDTLKVLEFASRDIDQMEVISIGRNIE